VEELYGGSGNDKLYGGTGNDKLYGGSGNDELYAGFGDNELYGGSGDDILHGGQGNDKLYGGSGNDLLAAGAGNNELYGGEGDDTLHGGPGDDLLVGGKGNDVLAAGGGNTTTFAWMEGDAGTVDAPALDTILDFIGSGARVLNLADLLQDEENSGDLSKYLNFSLDTSNWQTVIKTPESETIIESNYQTVIKVSSTGDLQADGSGYDQMIMLVGVDLANGSSDQNAIIKALIDQGKLVVDL